MLKSLRTAHAAAMALFLAGTAATLHARAEDGPVEQCVEISNVAEVIAEARDAGVPLQRVLIELRKQGWNIAMLRTAAIIYEARDVLTPREIRTTALTGCLEGKSI